MNLQSHICLWEWARARCVSMCILLVVHACGDECGSVRVTGRLEHPPRSTLPVTKTREHLLALPWEAGSGPPAGGRCWRRIASRCPVHRPWEGLGSTLAGCSSPSYWLATRVLSPAELQSEAQEEEALGGGEGTLVGPLLV